MDTLAGKLGLESPPDRSLVSITACMNIELCVARLIKILVFLFHKLMTENCDKQLLLVFAMLLNA
jgi:hypothetical protein